ncbi:TIGR04133 family radical SAM/SPASM protein [Chitinispirillales bacterium ANBcel5]|uniref:TIGR04133 family radical SAM/SPASM protein n=1 Tax=Cellulosispirillum alkaliphilum TaxID=3039283 RepID=UPI002A5229C6|nr:TIGR04133 family radical SAM/SPASM protein [Chitinispirillales bacterium ANBcel5]
MNKCTNLLLREKIALRLYSSKKKAEARAHELRYLFWECTLKCNLSCLHCGSDCSSDNTISDMPLEDFLAVLDSIKKTHDPSRIIVAITGGEPLMRKDLAIAGQEIRKRGFRWGIVTNGYLMNKDRFDELLGAGLVSMAISLDGFKEDHDWFRGKKDSYNRAIETIKYAVKAEGKKRIIFDIVTCVNQRNIGNLEGIKKLLVKLGVKRWRLASIFPKGRASSNTELTLQPQQLHQLMEFIKRTRSEGQIEASYGCQGFLGNYEMKVRSAPHYCRAGISIGSVLVDGSISACPSLRADYIQGNIYKDDFLQVWNNRYKVMRNRSWLRTGACKTCKVWKYCFGSGLHIRTEKSGELLYCEYNEMKKGDV